MNCLFLDNPIFKVLVTSNIYMANFRTLQNSCSHLQRKKEEAQ